ncbi:MAG: polyphosphate polymerase domain-containing protein [Ignavibacteriaceae bacterium]|nr:polyphosphate polymerase domain-containing protein [Ignavibacteriaceae bacterium]
MRLEYKYLIPNEKLNDLRQALIPFVNIDEYALNRAQKEYTVRSIYYDTRKLDDYRDKLAGIKIRKKIRIRGYNELENESPVFLEVKRKYENHISKNRSPVLYKNLNQILVSQDFDNLLIKKRNFPDERNDAIKFFYLLKKNNCLPIILIVYEREALFSKYDSTLRITFDKNLRSFPFPKLSQLYEEKGLVSVFPRHFVLEIKFYSGFPKWLQNVISHFGLGRQAVSKYTTCIDNHEVYKKYVNRNKVLAPSLLNGTSNIYKDKWLKNAG